MSEVVKICGVAFIGLVSVGIMKGIKNDFSSFVSIATGIILLGVSLASFYPVMTYVEAISENNEFSLYIETILKSLGIAVVTETAADICRDFGESAIAAKVEFAAKSVILMLSIPIVESLLTLAFGVLE